MTLENWQVPVSALGNADSFRTYINSIFDEIRAAEPGYAASLPPIAAQRDGHGDSRIIALELHTARYQQVVKLVDMKRASGFSKQQRTSLRDRTVAEAIANRFVSIVYRWNAATMRKVRNRIISTIRAC